MAVDKNQHSESTDQSGDGEVSTFQGLMTVLAATIDAGGQGTVFWMWLAALLGIATKYFECMLAGFGISNGVQSLEMAGVLSSYGIPDCRRNSTHWLSGWCCSSFNGWDSSSTSGNCAGCLHS
ncbi:alanine:cation symporter family protein [Synechococcus sp. W2B2]|uniref:alanine:cation symporter family protein n=1 Tax=unclassified Synechococcus TaxID=2626047 RepID=UPI0003003D31